MKNTQLPDILLKNYRAFANEKYRAPVTLHYEIVRYDEAEFVNNKIQEKAKEVYHHGDGSVTLTFPYVLGTAEIGEDWEDVYKPL